MQRIYGTARIPLKPPPATLHGLREQNRALEKMGVILDQSWEFDGNDPFAFDVDSEENVIQNVVHDSVVPRLASMVAAPFLFRLEGGRARSRGSTGFCWCFWQPPATLGDTSNMHGLFASIWPRARSSAGETC